ncbi:MAG TPA: formyltransferase family protein [Azospirillum sp.]|nr:formyltransferase family protein [Azospirillum sp.]
MAPNVVVLTEPKYSIVLLSIIEHFEPRAQVRFLFTAEDLGNYFAKPAEITRFIAFFTPVMVPAATLERIGSPAYNIHPGPPAYPGRYPVAFALYDGVRRFGATAHVMTARVDSGPIVAVAEFDVEDGADLDWLNARTYKAALKLFMHLCPALLRTTAPLPTSSIRWSERRSTRATLQAMCEIPPDIAPEELERRLRAFSLVAPEPFRLTLHGRRFRLVPEE